MERLCDSGVNTIFHISAGFLIIDNLSQSQNNTETSFKIGKPLAKLIWFSLGEVLLSDLDKSRAKFLRFLISFFPCVPFEMCPSGSVISHCLSICC